MRARSLSRRALLTKFVNDFSSAGAGRVFFFGGGISPFVTRSSTRTHVENVCGSFRSNLSADRSSPPFFVSLSWHSRQDLLMNLSISGRAAAEAQNVPAKKPKITLENKTPTLMDAS